MPRVHIPWKDSFRSGFSEIDEQHRALIALINDFLDRLAAECPLEDIHYYLAAIHEGIDFHFKEEEAVMRAVGYSGYGAHKADHDRLLGEIQDFKGLFIDPGIDPGTRKRKSELARAMDTWFSQHFGTYDRAFHHLHLNGAKE